MNHTVAVVIPFYKERLSLLEEISIQQCFKVLGNYPIIAVKPERLDLSGYPFQFTAIKSFENSFFDDIQGYNRLMMESKFYEQFLEYSFILIYQPDAFVFRDELMQWCSRGFDYIGAPWLVTYPDMFKWVKNKSTARIHTYLNLKQKGSNLPTRVQFDNRVGNGGLSLRNTKKLFDICQTEKHLIETYNQEAEHYYNEDAFFGIEVNRRKIRLHIPTYHEAVFFSIENYPEKALHLTKGKLPFGCHAWDQHLSFWSPVFKEAGIILPI